MILKFKENGKFAGRVGDPTVLVDTEGTPLYVGDLVYGRSNDNLISFKSLVCHTEIDGDFVMGIATSSSSLLHNGEIVNHVIKKIKDHKELKGNESYSGIDVISAND